MLSKLWRESRALFLTVVLFLLLMTGSYLLESAAAVEWEVRLHRLFFALLLASSLLSMYAFFGAYGDLQGRTGLLQFTLSLPVARRRLIVGPALVGASQSAILTLAGPGLLWALSPSLRAARGGSEMLIYTASVFAGQTLVFCVGFLLAVAVPLLWALYLYGAVTAFQWQLHMFEAAGGLGRAVREAGRLVLPFAARYLAPSLAACVILSALSLYATVRLFERRDF
jgi:hypothetical protein